MPSTVGVRELRQNLSRYLDCVKEGEAFVVTERTEKVARLTPSGVHDSALAWLIRERGATIPQGDLVERLGAPLEVDGRPPQQVLDELREDRI